jgi:hypothetical protein
MDRRILGMEEKPPMASSPSVVVTGGATRTDSAFKDGAGSSGGLPQFGRSASLFAIHSPDEQRRGAALTGGRIGSNPWAILPVPACIQRYGYYYILHPMSKPPDSGEEGLLNVPSSPSSLSSVRIYLFCSFIPFCCILLVTSIFYCAGPTATVSTFDSVNLSPYSSLKQTNTESVVCSTLFAMKGAIAAAFTALLELGDVSQLSEAAEGCTVTTEWPGWNATKHAFIL